VQSIHLEQDVDEQNGLVVTKPAFFAIIVAKGVPDFVDVILSVGDLLGVEDLSAVPGRGRIVISTPPANRVFLRFVHILLTLK